MAKSQLLSAMGDVVTFIHVPAIVVHLKKHVVLESNQEAIKKFGAEVGKGENLLIHLADETRSTYLKRKGHDEFELVEITEDDALFSFTRLSKTVGLLVDYKDSGRGGLQLSPDASCHPNFHFSYVHRLLNGQRSFPDPMQLKRLNLIDNPGEIDKLDWRNLILQEDRESYDKVITTALDHGGNHRIRYRIKNRDGGIHEVTDLFSVIREDGMWPILSGTIVSADGVDQKMQKVERLCLVGRLVGGMIHDFRNLLGGMQNMMEWCMAQSPKDGPIFKAMEKTVNYTDQANGLIKCTLRLLDDRIEMKDDFIPIKPLMKDAEAMIYHFGGSGIKVKVECEDNIPPIFGQRSVLLDCLLNLGLNACDAMEDSGDLLLFRAFCIDCNTQNTVQSQICIQVIDNGCGMTKEQSVSIFNEFFTTKKKGAGLGLWMVKMGIRNFGGVITVDSKLGIGTTFEIRLPLPEKVLTANVREKVQEDTRELTLEPLDFIEGKKVLYIEDEPLLRNSVHTWLDSMGFDVLVAEDGNTGLAMFHEHLNDIDLIIQDFILPGIKGDVLLDEFVDEAPQIPVIVCSGYPDGRDYNWLVDRGARAFLSKPFKIDKLMEIIEKIFLSASDSST